MQKLAWILVIVGALNWGLVAVGNFMGTNLNLVNLIFGDTILANIVYLLVGISALVRLPSWSNVE